MLFLNVPYSEKDEAKALGAKWNAAQKKWYVPDSIDVNKFERWMIHSLITMTISKEKEKLQIELVPQNAWYSNLRSILTVEEWQRVKQKTRMKAGDVCEICGIKELSNTLECHEKWTYDLNLKVQALVRTTALCSACHEAVHFGLARIKGRSKETRQHLMKVNGWNETIVDRHIKEAESLWLRRNSIEWKLDTRWLLEFVDLTNESRRKISDLAAGLLKRSDTTKCYSSAAQDTIENQMKNRIKALYDLNCKKPGGYSKLDCGATCENCSYYIEYCNAPDWYKCNSYCDTCIYDDAGCKATEEYRGVYCDKKCEECIYHNDVCKATAEYREQDCEFNCEKCSYHNPVSVHKKSDFNF